jgi:hypothetical protein
VRRVPLRLLRRKGQQTLISLKLTSNLISSEEGASEAAKEERATNTDIPKADL